MDGNLPIEIEWMTPLEVSFNVGVAIAQGRHQLRLTASDSEFALQCDDVQPNTSVRALLEPPTRIHAQKLLVLVDEGVRSRTFGPPTTTPREYEIIEDTERIAEVFSMLRKREAWIHVRPVLDPRQMLKARWHADGVLVAARATAWSPELALDCETEGPWSVYRYRAAGLASLEVPPAKIERTRHRAHRRVPAPRGMVASARHPLWPEVRISGELVDVGLGGFSFACDVERHMLFAGLELELEVAWRGRSIRCRGLVRHVSPRDEAARCGVEILDARNAWWSAVERVIHRATAVGVADVDTLWNIYTSSGYFGLSGKQPDDFDSQRLAFGAANRRLAEAPELGGCFVYRNCDQVLAAISQLQTCPGAWLVYQLGRSDDRPLHLVGVDVLAELYAHAYEHVAQYGSPRWLVNYVQDSAVWSKRIHLEVPERYIESSRASITRFRALEFMTHDEGSTSGFEIGPATDAELEILRAHAASIRPASYLSATGMDAIELPSDFLRAWQRRGLVRARTILVARRDGRAVAATVLDSCTRGLHLFRLTEACRLWWLADGGIAAAGALLSAAARWFRARGNSRYVLFWEYTAGPPDGARDLGGASLSVLDAGALPELVEDVYANTARVRARGVGFGDVPR